MLFRYKSAEGYPYEYPSYYGFRTKEEARQEHELYGSVDKIEFQEDTRGVRDMCVAYNMIRTYKWKRGGYLPKG